MRTIGSIPRTLLAVAWLACAACGTGVDLGGSLPGFDASDTGTKAPTCAAPDASAPCVACKPSDKDCQPNGCFGGYFCNIAERDCKEPGTGCSGDDEGH